MMCRTRLSLFVPTGFSALTPFDCDQWAKNSDLSARL